MAKPKPQPHILDNLGDGGGCRLLLDEFERYKGCVSSAKSMADMAIDMRTARNTAVQFAERLLFWNKVWQGRRGKAG